jgi:hypothetical protein
VPATRFGEHKRTGLYFEFPAVALIDSFTVGNVIDLIFIQNTALLEVEIVSRGVRTWRINHARLYLRLSCTVQEQAPVFVLLGRIQIFKKVFQDIFSTCPVMVRGTN